MSLLREALLQKKKIPQITMSNIFTNAEVFFDEMQAFVILFVFKKPSVKPKFSDFKIYPGP